LRISAQFTRCVRLSVLVSLSPPGQSDAVGCARGDDRPWAGVTCDPVVASGEEGVVAFGVAGTVALAGLGCCTITAGGDGRAKTSLYYME
jgi:hypothetical protein